MTESTVGKTFTIANNGNVFVGENLDRQNNGEYKLFVEKGIRTESIRVDVAADNGWADFVFDEDYKLMPTKDLEAYIKKHKHLPNVPSEKEVLENGIDLAEMNTILLRQIEELTLRVIELEKRFNALEEKNEK